jgi:ATP-binding protein involved in chromosome partitioning
MPPVTEALVLEALKGVRDPDLNRDIVSLGFVQDVKICGGDVAFTIELTTPACPVKDQMKDEAARLVQAIPGVSGVNVRMSAQTRGSFGPSPSQLTGKIKNVIPIASGKGGVGKSTVSVNLALALAARGAKVGLMDADVYGPSVPTILGAGTQPSQQGGRITPAVTHGIKMISTAFFTPEGEATILRGPMLHKLVEQFLGAVEWGELDYLLVDLPPGTGDVQLSLCQMIPLTGAVVVSTPQDVALKTAQKAIFMFNKLNCPVLGIVENMSYYICNHCGEREDIFGSGGAKIAAERLKVPFLGEIPLTKRLRWASDAGLPLVVSEPESPEAKNFMHLAGQLAAQVSIRNMRGELTQDIKVTF